MASRLNPYLNFAGDARSAMEFYQQVFGGELTVTTYGEFGLGEAADADKIMHAQLITTSGFALMGADAAAGMPQPAGTAITIALTGDDAEQLRGYFTKLAEGGTVATPLEKQVWGDEYGECVDRFGIPWMANIGTG